MTPTCGAVEAARSHQDAQPGHLGNQGPVRRLWNRARVVCGALVPGGPQVQTRFRVLNSVSGALESAGYRIEHSEAGLYLWTTRDERAADDAGTVPESSDWSLVSEMARLGILVAPGSFYGAAGRRHVRVALTASDERIRAATRRLARS